MNATDEDRGCGGAELVGAASSSLGGAERLDQHPPRAERVAKDLLPVINELYFHVLADSVAASRSPSR